MLPVRVHRLDRAHRRPMTNQQSQTPSTLCAPNAHNGIVGRTREAIETNSNKLVDETKVLAVHFDEHLARVVHAHSAADVAARHTLVGHEGERGRFPGHHSSRRRRHV